MNIDTQQHLYELFYLLFIRKYSVLPCSFRFVYKCLVNNITRLLYSIRFDEHCIKAETYKLCSSDSIYFQFLKKPQNITCNIKTTLY